VHSQPDPLLSRSGDQRFLSGRQRRAKFWSHREVPRPGPLYDQRAWYRYSPTPGERGPSV